VNGECECDMRHGSGKLRNKKKKESKERSFIIIYREEAKK